MPVIAVSRKGLQKVPQKRFRKIQGFLPPAAALAGLLAVIACTGATPVTTPTQVGSYNPSMLSYAASRGGMRVEVHGNPFDTPQAEVDRKVAETLTRAHRGPKFPVTSDEVEGQQTAYRLVMVFNAPPASYRICSTPPAESTPGNNVTLAAAFCHNDKWITTLGGRTTASGLEDPAFDRLLQQVAAALLPARNPDQDGAEDFDN